MSTPILTHNRVLVNQMLHSDSENGCRILPSELSNSSVVSHIIPSINAILLFNKKYAYSELYWAYSPMSFTHLLERQRPAKHTITNHNCTVLSIYYLHTFLFFFIFISRLFNVTLSRVGYGYHKSVDVFTN